jgi:hypothetical protein
VTRTFTQILIASAACIALAGCGGGSPQPSASGSSTTPQAGPTGTTSQNPFAGGTGPNGRPRTLTRARRAAILNRYALVALEVKSFGAPASPAELAAVSSSIKNYLAAAAAHEYAKACSMTIAARQRPVHGKQCPELLAATFASGYYKGLDKSFPALAVVGARLSHELSGSKGYALLASGESSKPELFIPLRREGGIWKPAVFAPFPLVPRQALARYEAALHESAQRR